MQKILVIGGTGLLGNEFVAQFSKNYEVIVGLHNIGKNQFLNLTTKLDICSKENITHVFNYFKPDVVINCAGLTNVEECEKFPEKAFLLNAIAPNYLSKASKVIGSKFVQISTDHFESESKIPRDELTIMNPINQYGFGKLFGERYSNYSNDNSLIIRTNFFGLKRIGETFLSKMLDSLKNSGTYFGFGDVTFTPIGVSTLVSGVKILLEKNYSGLINIGSREEITKFEFAQELLKFLNLPRNKCQIRKSSEVQGRVNRPKYLSLNSDKFFKITNFKVPDILTMIRQELVSLSGGHK